MRSSLYLSPPLGFYPSKEVDRAIFGTNFSAQKHEGDALIQSNGLSMTLIEFSLINMHKIKLDNSSRVQL